MPDSAPLRFVTEHEMQVEQLPWGPHDWLCRPGLTDAKDLALVRVHIPPGQGHAFHRHPEFEEIIYVLSGRCEQWVDREKRILTAGQVAHIPKDVVHGSYNAGEDTLEILAILSPARCAGPPLIDMSDQAPWNTLRGE
jgi:quercetin dioxygenase-like cupin family protein